MSKKTVRKNSNYKNNNKKGVDIMKNNDIEKMLEKVMEGKSATQKNVVEIVKKNFEAEGFNTDFLNNPLFFKTAKDLENMDHQLARWANKTFLEMVIESGESALSIFLNMNSEDFNRDGVIEQFAFFIQLANFISYGNYYFRAGFMDELCRITVECKGTEYDRVSSRAWNLFISLLLPNMAA